MLQFLRFHPTLPHPCTLHKHHTQHPFPRLNVKYDDNKSSNNDDPSIGTILCAGRWCCLSSLLDYWAQSWTGRHSDTVYQQAGTHFADLGSFMGKGTFLGSASINIGILWQLFSAFVCDIFGGPLLPQRICVMLHCLAPALLYLSIFFFNVICFC